MRLCFPTMDNNGLKSQVHNHFGSAAFFTIYDTEKQTVEVVPNNNDHHQHGTCQPVAAIKGFNVDVVLTSGMGRRAVMLFNDAGMKVYRLQGETVADAVRLFNAQELEELSLENACGGHDCH